MSNTCLPRVAKLHTHLKQDFENLNTYYFTVGLRVYKIYKFQYLFKVYFQFGQFMQIMTWSMTHMYNWTYVIFDLRNFHIMK